MENNIFKIKNFTLYYTSRSLANISDSIYSIAILWLVQTANISPSANGFVYATITTATLFSMFFGPIVDRHSAAKLSGIALIVQAIIVAVIPLIFNGHFITLIPVIVLIFIASLFSALYYPASNKLLTLIVKEPDKLQQANALIGSSDQVINLVGYLLGGILISLIGTNNAYYLSGALFVIASIAFVRLINSNLQLENTSKLNENYKKSFKDRFKNYINDIKSATTFIEKSSYLKIILPSTVLSGSIIAILIIILPAIGEKYGSAIYYSGLYVAFFIGFIVGAILTNFIKASGLYVALSWLGNGLALLILSLVNNWWLVALSLSLFGFFSGVMNVVQMSLIQIMTPSHIMGRVMATLSTINNIATPLGSIVGGLLLLQFDIKHLILGSTIVFLISSIYLLSQATFVKFDVKNASDFKLEYEKTVI
jgi:MFS family permease